MGGFSNPIVGGAGALVRPAIKSPNYVPGTSGWSINSDGSAEFTNVQITVSGTTSGLQVVRSGDGALVGSINDQGVISGQSLSIAGDTDSVEIGGSTLSSILSSQAANILAYGEVTAGGPWTSGFYAAIVFELAFTAPVSKRYHVNFGGWLAGDNAGGTYSIQILDGGASQPSVFSPMILWAGHGVAKGGVGEFFGGFMPYYFTAGLHRLIMVVGPYAGGPGNASLGVSPAQPAYIEILDTPPGVANTAVPTTPPVNPVQTYTTQWVATWSGTYDGSGNWESGEGNNADQGSYDGSSGHNRRGMIGFDSASIMSALSGATINACNVTITFFHWYNNAGGTAVIGTHGQSSRPGSFSGTTNRIQSGGWPKPGTRTVDLGAGIGAEFQNGATRGITLGPGPSTAATYYGKAYGAGNAVLTITYTK